MTRAQRNNNPGNLNSGDHWQGLMPRTQMTPAQAAETRFAVFSEPKWGFRALTIIILNYERLHGLHTVRGIISRWAPPSENDTAAYIAAVSEELDCFADEALDFTDAKVVGNFDRAIAIHESGGWLFTEADLAAGVQLAMTEGA